MQVEKWSFYSAYATITLEPMQDNNSYGKNALMVTAVFGLTITLIGRIEMWKLILLLVENSFSFISDVGDGFESFAQSLTEVG